MHVAIHHDLLNYRNRYKAGKTIKLLNFISKQDQAMTPDVLISRTRLVFLKLQDCWTKRDYAPMKGLMMPDLFEQHNQQLAGMIRNHEINQLDSVKITRIDLVNIRYTEKKEQREFTALITAYAQDYYVDDRTGEFIRGDSTVARFQEFWTFQFLESEWLLREIEQTRESRILTEENFFEQFTDQQIEQVYQAPVDQLGKEGPSLEKKVLIKAVEIERMLNYLAQTDKIWTRQLMLERARKIFTNVHMALEVGALNAELESQLFPAVVESINKTLKEWKSKGESMEYRNFCVRKVELLLVRSFSDNTKDEFFTRISAHAQRIHLSHGNIVTKDDDVTPFEAYWTFGRLDKEWKFKEAMPRATRPKQIINAENIEEESSPDMVKWYYTKKRAL